MGGTLCDNDFNIISKFWQINKDVIPKLIVPISKTSKLYEIVLNKILSEIQHQEDKLSLK